MAKAQANTHTKTTPAEVRDELLEARERFTMALGRVISVLRLVHVDGEDAEYVNPDGSKRGGFKSNHNDIMMLVYMCTDLLGTTADDISGSIGKACAALDE